MVLTTVTCLGFVRVERELPERKPHYRAPCEFDGPEIDQRPCRTVGRALSAGNGLKLTKTTLRALLNRTRTASPRGPLSLVMDSGCTMSCHPYAGDLINHRPSRETMSGIDGIKRKVRLVGDLPVVARDHCGKLRQLLIRNVRCVPEFTDTLISVDRLWEEAGSDGSFY
jgi:hypothetical protein